MAVIVFSEDPKQLWSLIKAGIVQGTIKTWEFDDTGKFFTHKSSQWAKKAWWRAAIGDGVLTFNIVKPKTSNISTDVYAEYHALLIRMLLADFDRQFTNAVATAMPKKGDMVATR